MPTEYEPVWRPDAMSKASRVFFYSPTLRRPACAANKLHFHRILLLEGEEAQSYCEYPLKVRDTIKGRPVRALVHFWVRYRDGKEAFESLSYHEERNRSAAELAQLTAKGRWCEQHGHDHRVLTRFEVRADIVKVGNWGRILGYYDARNHPARRSQIEAAMAALLEVVRQGRRVSVGAALSAVSAHHQVSDARLALFELLRDKAIDAELSRYPFDAHSNLTLL